MLDLLSWLQFQLMAAKQNSLSSQTCEDVAVKTTLARMKKVQSSLGKSGIVTFSLA